MHFSSTILPLFVAALSYVGAAPTAEVLESQIRDLAQGTVMWKGVVKEGGPNVTLTGDIESIYKQVHALNPEYVPIHDPYVSARSTPTISKRASAWPPNCSPQDFNWCYLHEIRMGISYLTGLGGTIGRPPGCGRVSCSWDSSIYLCNDQHVTIWVPPQWIADYAGGIANVCQKTGPFIQDMTRGQLFYADGSWNVIVRKDGC